MGFVSNKLNYADKILFFNTAFEQSGCANNFVCGLNFRVPGKYCHYHRESERAGNKEKKIML